MKWKDYVADHMVTLLILLFGFFCVLWMTQVYGRNVEFTLAIGFVLVTSLGACFVYDYGRRRQFYREFSRQLERLSEKYLITELVSHPRFYEGRYLCESLYEIDKSMQEHLLDYKHQLDDFRAYLELWIHEVKLPISSLYLMLHNHPSSLNNRLGEQVDRIDRCTEQVLYYMRANNSEKDYLIGRHSLKEIVYEVVAKHRDQFRYEKMGLELKHLDEVVYTDSKWLAFMLSQIVQNAFQYMRHEQDIMIFDSWKEGDELTLMIEDHGLGIKASELPRVFEKSFTGSNGRVKRQATGMGLYLCKLLCEKMGHRICIESKENAWTRVLLTFKCNDYYDVL